MPYHPCLLEEAQKKFFNTVQIQKMQEHGKTNTNMNTHCNANTNTKNTRTTNTDVNTHCNTCHITPCLQEGVQKTIFNTNTKTKTQIQQKNTSTNTNDKRI